MSKIFLHLGFARANGLESEQRLVGSIWKTIGGDAHGQGKVPLKRVKSMLCALQNFHIDWIMDYDREEGKYTAPSQLGRIDHDGNFVLLSDEITKISQKYVPLYQNRLTKVARDKKNDHIDRQK